MYFLNELLMSLRNLGESVDFKDLEWTNLCQWGPHIILLFKFFPGFHTNVMGLG